MRVQGFRAYMQDRGIPDREIETQVAFIQNLEVGLKKNVPTWTLMDLNRSSFQSVVDELIDQGENTIKNLEAIASYAKVINNQAMFLAVYQMLDGCEAMDRLHDKVGAYVGDDLRDMIFEGMPLPPLGVSRREKARYTYQIMHRMETIFEESTCREILQESLCTLPESEHQENKKAFLDSCNSDIDKFLLYKGNKFLKILKECQHHSELFFGQVITEEVIDFISNNPQIGQGVRDGNIIFETKLPDNTEAYLYETDPVMKRYNYCHCPWAKESLRKGTFVVSPIFCQCSASLHKKRYEVIYDQPIQAEVLKSVLKGDMVCQFAIHLPE